MTSIVAWLALVVALVALVAHSVSVFSVRRPAPGRPRRRSAQRPSGPPDLETLRDDVEALRADAAESLRHVAVVRYDAFGDMGGHLSWSMALLDDGGNGVVFTSIHGRSEARTYAKNIAGWSCDQPLSPEEDEAIGFARPSR
ncbi:MAG: DUF4446 family protein [Nocardioidaceae bacterium]